MKQYIALLACVFVLAACGNQSESDKASADKSASSGSENAASTDSGNTSGDFANEDEKRSYALGMDIGNSLKELPVKLDLDALSQGVRDTVNGGDTRLTQKQLDGVMQSFVQDMQSAQKKKAKEQAQTNLGKGKKFLADNKDKDGVKTTDSGLQYKVVKKGDGPSPDENDSVTVHYVGKLIDGTVFDSSRKRGEPVTFPVNAVIPGWTEALQLMKQGAEYKLFIPPDLAYGERGAGAQIGPNETLVFDVELLKVDKNKGTKAADDNASDQSDDQDSGDSSTQGSAAGNDDSSAAQSPDDDSGSGDAASSSEDNG